MNMLGGRQSAFEVAAWIADRTSGRHRVAKHLPAVLEGTVRGIERAARLDSAKDD